MNNKLSGVKLNVVGVTFNNDNGLSRQALIGMMDKSSPVSIKREPTNRFDKNAVMVLFADQQIGYIGKQYSAVLAPLMDAGRKFKASVEDVGTYKDVNYCHITVDEE